MGGLSSLTSTTSSAKTELPSWYQTAQQDVIGRAQQGASQVPEAAQTTGQQAVNLLQSPNNPYQQAQGVLGDIASGAANPWNVDASGTLTPNTNTALGGLYAAQRQYLQDILPDVDAQANAAAIGSGQFGSLRGQTALHKARADAFNKLANEQLQNALTAQTQGIQASSALGNIGTQNIDAALKGAEWQQSSPFAASANLGKIINPAGAYVGSNVTKSANRSPLETANILGTLATGPLSRAVLGQFGVQGGTSQELLSNLFGKVFGGGGGGGGGGIALPGGGIQYMGQEGHSTIANPDGSYTINYPDGSSRMISPSGEDLGTVPAQEDYAPSDSAFTGGGADETWYGDSGDTGYQGYDEYDYGGDF